MTTILFILSILSLVIAEGASNNDDLTCGGISEQNSSINMILNSNAISSLENDTVEDILNESLSIVPNIEPQSTNSLSPNLIISTTVDNEENFETLNTPSSASTVVRTQLTSRSLDSSIASPGKLVQNMSANTISASINKEKTNIQGPTKLLASSITTILPSISNASSDIDLIRMDTIIENSYNSGMNISLNDSLINNNGDDADIIIINKSSINILGDESRRVIIAENHEDEDAMSDLLSFEEWVQKNVNNNNNNGKDTYNNKQRNSQKLLSGDQRKIESNEYLFGEENEVNFDIFSDSSLNDDNDNDEKSLTSGKYKKRFNFASADCAATIVKANKEAKGASALLIENKESYMLNECNVKESYVIIELCEDILIDTVSVGNYEYFSSIFKDLEVFASDRYPIPDDDWELLGNFEAKNIREIQSFSIKYPAIWARYLKIEFKTHYGNKFYCPVSSIKVHGRTMMEEYKIEESKKLKSDNIGPDLLIQQDSLHQRSFKDGSEANDSAKTNDESKLKKKNNEDDNDIEDSNLNVCSDNQRTAYGFEDFLMELKKDELCESVTFLNSSKLPMDEMKVRELVGNNTLKSTSLTKRAGGDSSGNGGQESIYKNIMNRLSLLELNSTLSMLYLAEQSKALGESFSKLEKKQSRKFNLLVMALNETLQLQMEEFKRSFLLIRKESESLIENQSKLNQEINHKVDYNFKLLSDELSFQKKIVFILFMILICLLIFVLLTKDRLIEGEFLEEFLEEPARSKTPVLNSSEESSLLEYSGQELPQQQPLKKKWKLKIGSSLGLMTKAPLSPKFRVFKDDQNFKHAKSYSTGNIDEDIENLDKKHGDGNNTTKDLNGMISPEASDTED